jgi:hypothetical protein
VEEVERAAISGPKKRLASEATGKTVEELIQQAVAKFLDERRENQ